MKEILILPISGGSFHIQLFLSIELINCGFCKPDVILGNSGGSINSYILLQSDLKLWTSRYQVTGLLYNMYFRFVWLNWILNWMIELGIGLWYIFNGIASMWFEFDLWNDMIVCSENSWNDMIVWHEMIWILCDLFYW